MIENKTNSFEIDDKNLALLSSGLNSEQLEAVKTTENVVVSAGAGSGKTTVLASRYAYLVEAKNIPCDRILTLTFTKKAANEMKERIFYGLKFHLDGKDIKGKKSLPENFPHIKEIKERARDAIEHFDRTYIQTLDSYFSKIAKYGARHYGIIPNFTLDDEKIKTKINYLATKYVLENLEKAEIKQIAEIFKIQNVAEELFANPILKYSTVLTPIDFGESLKKQKNAILEEYKAIVGKISDAFDDFLKSDFNNNRDLKAKEGSYKKNLYDYFDKNGNPSAPDFDETVFESEENTQSFLNGKFFTYCHTISEILSSRLGQCWRVSEYNDFKGKFSPLLEKLYLLANSIAGFSLQKKIFAHLERFQKIVNDTKRTGGLLSFADVSRLAVTILCDQADIRHIEQAKFDAIMIDEFQDDNQLQCDVLLILSDTAEKFENGKYIIPKLSDSDLLDRIDKNKLFFVGDDKQSIYRFRGADVTVFRNLSSSIKKTLDLKTNYRSEAELIAGFNTIFGGYSRMSGDDIKNLQVERAKLDEDSKNWSEEQRKNLEEKIESLQKKVDTASQAVFMTKEKFLAKTLKNDETEENTEQIPLYEADYKKVSTPSFRIKENSFSEKQITLAFYPKNDENAEDEKSAGASADSSKSESSEDRKTYELEASYVASEIKKLREIKIKDKDGNLIPKYNYKDIALLFRTSTATADYENVLLQAGIPYSTEVYKGFFSDGPVNDILALLKLCVYPEDKNAYAKLLRSPFCALTFAETEKVLVNSPEPFKSPFDEEMFEAIQDDSELCEKVTNLKNMYDDIKTRLSTEKLTKTISYIWYNLGYRYETMWNNSVAMHASSYDILFEMAHLSEGKTQSLASFIDMVKSYEDSDAKLEGLDVVIEAEDAVQILTTHKSKGLEFKVVFVCAASASPKTFGATDTYSQDFGYCLKTPTWTNFQKAAEKLSKTFKSTIENNNYFLTISKEEDEKQESAELRRLAYVAFTRAEEKLYIVGNSKGEFDDEHEAEKKCRPYELHAENEKEFKWTKRYTYSSTKKEWTALNDPNDDATEEYKYPKSIYQLLLPILYQGTDNQAFNFVNDRDSFKKVSIDEDLKKTKKSDFIKNLPDFAENDETASEAIITEELSPQIYINPSKLGGKQQAETKSQNSEEKLPFANPDYALINKIIASTIPAPSSEIPDLEDNGEESDENYDEFESQSNGEKGGEESKKEFRPEFNFKHFGTIAHKYMEATVLKKLPGVSGKDFNGINEADIPNVDIRGWEGNTKRKKKILKIRELCADMVEHFKKSEIFAEALSSDWVRAEYDFRSSYENDSGKSDLVVKGQIDLVYKNGSDSPYKYTVVDYKTNQRIEPENYFAQLACYRTAVSQMLGIPESEIRCILYYLRFAKEVDITSSL